jgi:hypothetical protein
MHCWASCADHTALKVGLGSPSVPSCVHTTNCIIETSVTIGVPCGCAVLCCAVLCCAVLCCAVLCCAVLCCAVLCCAVLSDALCGWARLLRTSCLRMLLVGAAAAIKCCSAYSRGLLGRNVHAYACTAIDCRFLTASAPHARCNHTTSAQQGCCKHTASMQQAYRTHAASKAQGPDLHES